ncbi:MAG TPA: hypothetical protein VEX13_15890 [Chloroflexia bacterium]|nr:hypothetical protein [Chloroflexia bacterium]
MNLNILEQLVRETRRSNLLSRQSSMHRYGSLLTLAERKAVNSLAWKYATTTPTGMGTPAVYFTGVDRVNRIWF